MNFRVALQYEFTNIIINNRTWISVWPCSTSSLTSAWTSAWTTSGTMSQTSCPSRLVHWLIDWSIFFLFELFLELSLIEKLYLYTSFIFFRRIRKATKKINFLKAVPLSAFSTSSPSIFVAVVIFFLFTKIKLKKPKTEFDNFFLLPLD